MTLFTAGILCTSCSSLVKASKGSFPLSFPFPLSFSLSLPAWYKKGRRLTRASAGTAPLDSTSEYAWAWVGRLVGWLVVWRSTEEG